MNNQSTLYIDGYGHKFWRIDGQYHREDGPAIELADGTKRWYIKGKLHREDGPAIEYYNGGGVLWYLNGQHFYKKELWFQRLTPEQQYNYLWNLDE